MSERIQKLLSSLGYGSRREIEEWVQEGRLTVNGATAEVGQKVDESDAVKLDGKRISLKSGNEPMRVLLYKKRTGEMVTREDPEGRRTVFRKLPELETGRWIAVGRLDVNTSGLLLLTNHGELARRLMHPSFEQLREYAVRALGEVSDEAFGKLRKGVNLEDGEAHFNSIRFGDNEPDLDTSDDDGEGEPVQGRANHWFVVTIAEGRHREVRRLFESQGLTVNRLIRTGYGPIKLGRGIKSGSYREATADEITKLLDAVQLPHSERLPERVRDSHKNTSEFSRSGPNALPNPKKKAVQEGGWVRASKEERKEVERGERRAERFEQGPGAAAKTKRSFSSTGPRKPGAPAGARPYTAASERPKPWAKPAASESSGGDGEQFKARGFGAKSERSYVERGDGAPSRARPRPSGMGDKPAGERPWQRKSEEGSAWKKPSGDASATGPRGPRSDRPAWPSAPAEGSERRGPRADGGGSAWASAKPARAGDDKPVWSSKGRDAPAGDGDRPQFKPRSPSFARTESAPRFGREGAAPAPAWKKPDAPRSSGPRQDGERPRFNKPRAEGDAAPRYGKGARDAKPSASRPYGEKAPFVRREHQAAKPARPAGQKYEVRNGKAVGAKPRMGLKRKPDADE